MVIRHEAKTTLLWFIVSSANSCGNELTKKLVPFKDTPHTHTQSGPSCPSGPTNQRRDDRKRKVHKHMLQPVYGNYKQEKSTTFVKQLPISVDPTMLKTSRKILIYISESRMCNLIQRVKLPGISGNNFPLI